MVLRGTDDYVVARSVRRLGRSRMVNQRIVKSHE